MSRQDCRTLSWNTAAFTELIYYELNLIFKNSALGGTSIFSHFIRLSGTSSGPVKNTCTSAKWAKR